MVRGGGDGREGGREVVDGREGGRGDEKKGRKNVGQQPGSS